MTWHALVATALLTGIVVSAKPALAEPPCLYSASAATMRPQTRQLAELLDIGVRKSATLRQLVQDVEARCGVVFISGMDLALARRKAVGVTVHRINVVGPFRYVHVIVDTRPGAAEVIGTIGHELQHVVEILEAGVTTSAEISVLFVRIGVKLGAGVFETTEAAEVGAQVRREVQYPD